MSKLIIEDPQVNILCANGDLDKVEFYKIEHRIDEIKNRFIRGVKAKHRSTRRKWMELNILASSHSLLLLPYQAMLGHVGLLVEERRKDFPLTPLPPLSGIFPSSASDLSDTEEVNQSRLLQDTENDNYLALPVSLRPTPLKNPKLY